MSRNVQCAKLDKEAEGLEFLPYPGELGEKIFANISKEAWKLWLGHQTMLINEYRLSTIDPKSREFLETEMDKFLFSKEGGTTPEGFVPPSP